MLANRLQNASSLLFQNQFGFATKNLKQIKIRMKAVESIKKITKVLLCLSRPWRWWQPPRWSKMWEDLKEPRATELAHFNESFKMRHILQKRKLTLMSKNGSSCQSHLIKVFVVESTQTSSEKSKLWSKLTEVPIRYSLLGTRDQLLWADPWLTS